MSTDGEKPLNGKPEPFRRPVTWGKPPQTVFRAGPLPRGEPLPRRPEPAQPWSPRPEAVGRSILGGSMIPRAAPRPDPAVKEPAIARAPEPKTEALPPAGVPAGPEADPAARPRPAIPPRPEPVPSPALILENLPAFQSATRAEPVPMTPPRPDVGIMRGRLPGRTVLYVVGAVIALAVLAGVAWMLSRPPVGAPVSDATPPAPVAAARPPATAAATPQPAGDTSALTVPEIQPAAPVVEARPAQARAAPAPRAAAPAVQVRPAVVPGRPVPRPRSPPPVQVTPPAAAPAPPVGQVVPAPGPAPTAAERLPEDPDGPIATRPQPIGQTT